MMPELGALSKDLRLRLARCRICIAVVYNEAGAGPGSACCLNNFDFTFKSVRVFRAILEMFGGKRLQFKV
jgi:hypothetical protein